MEVSEQGTERGAPLLGGTERAQVCPLSRQLHTEMLTSLCLPSCV